MGANAVSATAAEVWVLCIGQPGAGNQPKAVYSSIDGLKSWQQLAAVALFGAPGGPRMSSAGIPSYGYPVGLNFSGEGTGLLLESRGTTFLSPDSGARWHPLLKVTEPERNFGASASVLNSGHAFLLQTPGTTGASMVLLSSDDGGATWKPVHAWRGRPGY